MNSVILWKNACKPPKPNDLHAWNGIINNQLIEWGRDKKRGNKPLPNVLNLACKVAIACRDSGWESPNSVGVNNKGDITFRRKIEDYSQELTIKCDGNIELTTYHNLTYRNTYVLELNNIGKR